MSRAQAEEESGLALVKRLYMPRVFGTALAALCIAAALLQHGTPGWVWVVLALHALVWPHLAYRWARTHDSPRLGVHRNLMVDSALGGFWIAAMGGNLLPSVLVIKTVGTGVLAVGGWRLALPALLAFALGALAGMALLGVHLELRPDLLVVVAAIPLLLSYPVLFGLTAYRLSRELKRQQRALRILNEHDWLSGLGSRAWLDERLRVEFSRAGRYGRSIALLLLDVDRFKSINDTLGHTAGDEVIRGIGQLLRDSVRTGDMVGRYGGEEFAVILPETSADAALVLAERLRAKIASHEFRIRDKALRVTISGGIAALPSAAGTYVDWVRRADRALYRAKNEGRDRVLVERDEPVPAGAC